jgi:hypothetical protein
LTVSSTEATTASDSRPTSRRNPPSTSRMCVPHQVVASLTGNMQLVRESAVKTMLPVGP